MRTEYIHELITTTVVDVVAISAGYCRGEIALMLTLQIGDSTQTIVISATQALEIADAAPRLFDALNAFRSN